MVGFMRKIFHKKILSSKEIQTNLIPISFFPRLHGLLYDWMLNWNS